MKNIELLNKTVKGELSLMETSLYLFISESGLLQCVGCLMMCGVGGFYSSPQLLQSKFGITLILQSAYKNIEFY